jgi:hypothetical protein
MHRDKGRRRAVRVVLMALLIALVFSGIAMTLTHAEALADFSWSLGR